MSLNRIDRFKFRPSWYQSIRFRLTVLFVSIFGVTVTIFSVLLYQSFLRTHQTEFDAALFNHAVDVSQSLNVDFFGDLSVRADLLASGGKLFPFSLGKAHVEIRDLEGREVARSKGLRDKHLPWSAEELAILIRHGLTFRTIELGANYRLVNYLVDKPNLPKLILQIAVPMSYLERERIGLFTFLLAAIPLTLVAATFGGWYLSRRALAPVGIIIQKADEISASALSERIPIPGSEDELKQLTLTLNGLLDRLESAFQSQERFIADASHQLRTPLSVLRGELDLIRKRPRSQDELDDFLQSASQEINLMTKMVEDLLVLARVDAGKGTLASQKVRLDELALDAIARFEPLARQKSVKIRLNLEGGNFEARGDPGLIQCLFQNLIENAIKYSPPSEAVCVELIEHGEMLRIRVADRGPGIPAESLERIFDRYFRSDAVKGRIPGTGLGLPIAKRIAEVHGGTITASSELGNGSTFEAKIKKT